METEKMSIAEVESLLRCVGAILRRDDEAAREHRARFRKARAARERQTITVYGEAVV